MLPTCVHLPCCAACRKRLTTASEPVVVPSRSAMVNLSVFGWEGGRSVTRRDFQRLDSTVATPGMRRLAGGGGWWWSLAADGGAPPAVSLVHLRSSWKMLLKGCHPVLRVATAHAGAGLDGWRSQSTRTSTSRRPVVLNPVPKGAGGGLCSGSSNLIPLRPFPQAPSSWLGRTVESCSRWPSQRSSSAPRSSRRRSRRGGQEQPPTSGRRWRRRRSGCDGG